MELLHDWQIDTLSLRWSPRWRAHLAVDVLLGSVPHTGTEFAYDPGVDLRILGFLFIPQICFGERATVCGGIGEGTVNTNGPRNAADFGTWNYQLETEYWLTDHVRLVALGKLVGAIEQVTDGEEHQYSFFMAGAGLGLSL